jgi:hypothetical protein
MEVKFSGVGVIHDISNYATLALTAAGLSYHMEVRLIGGVRVIHDISAV